MYMWSISLLCQIVLFMEVVFNKYGVSHRNVPQSEFIRDLERLPLDDLHTIRFKLFDIASGANLIIPGSSLVSRRDTPANPIRSKLSLDIWTITKCLENHSIIPRVLLKGGKKGRTQFEASLHGHNIMVMVYPCPITLRLPSIY